jgi:hypothetical protein
LIYKAFSFALRRPHLFAAVSKGARSVFQQPVKMEAPRNELD